MHNIYSYVFLEVCAIIDFSLSISEEMVSQLFDEGFPSCGSDGCWSWNSGYSGGFFLVEITFVVCLSSQCNCSVSPRHVLE